MEDKIIGVAVKDLKKGQVCILGKDIQTHGECRVKIKEDKMAEENGARGLFEIRVVDLETDKVVHSEEVVAEGEQDALYESGVKDVLEKLKLRKDDVKIMIREFGALPKRQRARKLEIKGQLGKTIIARETDT